MAVLMHLLVLGAFWRVPRGVPSWTPTVLMHLLVLGAFGLRKWDEDMGR